MGGELLELADHRAFQPAGGDVGLGAGTILGAAGAGVVPILALAGVPRPLDEHGCPTSPAARETHQGVLRGQPPRPELLLDRLERIFPHEWFMGSSPFLAAPDYSSQVRRRPVPRLIALALSKTNERC